MLQNEIYSLHFIYMYTVQNSTKCRYNDASLSLINVSLPPHLVIIQYSILMLPTLVVYSVLTKICTHSVHHGYRKTICADEVFSMCSSPFGEPHTYPPTTNSVIPQLSTGPGTTPWRYLPIFISPTFIQSASPSTNL